MASLSLVWNLRRTDNSPCFSESTAGPIHAFEFKPRHESIKFIVEVGHACCPVLELCSIMILA